MEEVLQYLKNCSTFYLATMEEDQPRVRPFGAICEYEGKLYIITNNQKNVFAQMQTNPKVELSGMYDGTWIRVQCEVVLDQRPDARVAMLEEYPSLQNMYAPDDGIVEVLYMKNVVATIHSFKEVPKSIAF